jgi:hypothetical protein
VRQEKNPRGFFDLVAVAARQSGIEEESAGVLYPEYPCTWQYNAAVIQIFSCKKTEKKINSRR